LWSINEGQRETVLSKAGARSIGHISAFEERMDKTKEGDIQWVHCNQCRRVTQHEIIKIREVKEDEGYSGDILQIVGLLW
jgi:hypothetical protein